MAHPVVTPQPLCRSLPRMGANASVGHEQVGTAWLRVSRWLCWPGTWGQALGPSEKVRVRGRDGQGGRMDS